VDPQQVRGRENLEALDFLRRLNETVYGEYPDVQTIAEESTAWPMVSRPLYLGGLGFGMKWDMGWMHDTLDYFAHDPIFRAYHHNQLTFRMMYAFTENFMLPLSHDEVVHGKGSMIRKMPGDQWQQFANLRALYAYMYTQPAKKLLFMGSEFGQWAEWAHDSGLDWHLTDSDPHQGSSGCSATSTGSTGTSPPCTSSTVSRGASNGWTPTTTPTASSPTCAAPRAGDTLLVAANFTPQARHGYRVGVPHPGRWAEILNTDAAHYGGSGQGNMGGVETGPLPVPVHGRDHSIDIVIPPLGVVVLKHEK
jgi:1,4-alpha-glucan branching enzyme